jgi:hypothetical protein
VSRLGRSLLLATGALVVLAGGVVLAAVVGPTPGISPAPQASCAAGDQVCWAALIDDHVADGDIAAALDVAMGAGSAGGACHSWGHEIGRAAASVFDPVDAFGLNSDDIDQRCDYGYLHGVFQGYQARGERDLGELVSVGCPTQRSGWWRNECLHGLGHAVAAASSTLDMALSSCSQLGGPPLNLDRADTDSCASGVFMEYASAYLDAEAAMTPQGATGAPKLTDAEAAVVCNGAWVEVCARKAALFWGPTTEESNELGSRCAELGGDTVALDCGASIGEWLRNSLRWPVPDTVDAADTVSGQAARECQRAAAGAGDQEAGVLYGCLEGVIVATLPGQVAAGMKADTWFNPCTKLTPPLPGDAGTRCTALWDRVVSDVAAGRFN